jgi:hypothetical protein
MLLGLGLRLRQVGFLGLGFLGFMRLGARFSDKTEFSDKIVTELILLLLGRPYCNPAAGLPNDGMIAEKYRCLGKLSQIQRCFYVTQRP